ncbi:hypothetical protein BTH42_26900 [Burkholderia sp. SRS-W-2-2016]|uniref:TetR/AcrR family transcriptional regulator n=1 Tax=Burkholderia sp. SRS-W-2-2016 TaxID=1926878 RepID=UPI00094AD79B|nr:TetR/AcrR family transcriptional regulator [Burkholderia sp. SRS-W-2-2016]OLL28627.1 hypothetical protein BTH42_26900 [Burkholderia sp. SRS-W-2-2016]
MSYPFRPSCLTDILASSIEYSTVPRGLSATLDDVARHAGVGVGTAYRHSPNKQALASEVLEGAMQQLIADAEAALAAADPSRKGFAGFFETVVATQARHRGLHHLSPADGIASPQVQKRFEQAAAGLFERAQRAGGVRADACATDIGPLLVMMRTVIDLSPPAKPELWRLHLAFLLDGMRAAGLTPTSVEGLSMQEFDDFLATRKRAVK